MKILIPIFIIIISSYVINAQSIEELLIQVQRTHDSTVTVLHSRIDSLVSQLEDCIGEGNVPDSLVFTVPFREDSATFFKIQIIKED